MSDLGRVGRQTELRGPAVRRNAARQDLSQISNSHAARGLPWNLSTSPAFRKLIRKIRVDFFGELPAAGRRAKPGDPIRGKKRRRKRQNGLFGAEMALHRNLVGLVNKACETKVGAITGTGTSLVGHDSRQPALELNFHCQGLMTKIRAAPSSSSARSSQCGSGSRNQRGVL